MDKMLKITAVAAAKRVSFRPRKLSGKKGMYILKGNFMRTKTANGNPITPRSENQIVLIEAFNFRSREFL